MEAAARRTARWSDDIEKRKSRNQSRDAGVKADKGHIGAQAAKMMKRSKAAEARKAAARGIDITLFKTILRKLDFDRVQFEKTMEDYSGGQKKKVLIAASLCEEAHLYVWDEPLNYVDVLSRIQVEELQLAYAPTMIFVEHDAAFCENTATDVVEL